MRLHEIRHIDLPLEEVFGYVADFANTEQWDPGIKSARQIGGGQVGVGTKYNVVSEFGSSEIPMVYEIVEYEPHSQVVLTGEGDTIGAVDTILFEETEGGTRVDYTADLTFKNWMKYLDPLLAPVMRRMVGKKALDGLVATLSS
ncbi:MAG: SRPBCC family protein [Acidimicrobiia bacterium]|jgi:carbon monoxide dehydrogenase subunit G